MNLLNNLTKIFSPLPEKLDLSLRRKESLLMVGVLGCGKTRVLRAAIENVAAVESVVVVAVTQHSAHWTAIPGAAICIFEPETGTQESYRQAFEAAVIKGRKAIKAGDFVIFVLDDADAVNEMLVYYKGLIENDNLMIVAMRKSLDRDRIDCTMVSKFNQIAVFKIHSEKTRECIRRASPAVPEALLQSASLASAGKFFVVRHT
jgi:hypothetical protein